MSEIFSRLVGTVTGRGDQGSPHVRNVLKETENVPIVRAAVCREPVKSSIQKILNVVSFGAFKKKVNSLGYDQVYHLFLHVGLQNGNSYRIEKNEVVTISSGGPPSGMGSACQNVPIRGTYSINDMFNKGIQGVGEHDFWHYDFASTNCQHFVRTLLNGVRWLTPELQKFIMQDAGELVKTVPSVFKKFGNFLTNLASKFDVLFHGRGACHCGEWHDVVPPPTIRHKGGYGTKTGYNANKFFKLANDLRERHRCTYKKALQEASKIYKKKERVKRTR